ncbi:sigma-54-dependent Fis family transcriptional regulator [Paenibacillus piri]|uniref:Sigma-54-dependent Fis family transcriptional regulator n=1 Tax=Paenibacillus piri TaxID=2547395 RepID=A0A4R5KLS4_9BACL|nr:sigma-54-dependent Fis family transcriptional regulator [Paenibacillus piri]TDF95440.1 sigma-54-dependent Fis family transcriptional regulator [Paenibacillus piri]
MKIKTLVIAPYRGLLELTSSLAEQFDDFELTVIQGDLSESLNSIRQYEAEGYDIIISRGVTASLIKENSKLPVVEIKVSGYDILRLITLLKEYKTQIEMIGFPHIIEAVVAVSRLLNVEIPHTIIHKEDEVDRALENAKKKGALVIVGGTHVVRMAKEKGLQGILITSGKESVLEAFENARNMYHAISGSKFENNMMDSLSNGLETGMAVIRADGELSYFNQSFLRIFNIRSENEASRALHAKLPNLMDLLQKAVKKRQTKTKLELFDPTYKHKITILSQQNDQNQSLFNMYVRPVGESENDIQVQYMEQFLETFPQLIQARGDFQQALNTAMEGLRQQKLVTMYGEMGTGKRVLAGTIQKLLNVEEEHLFDVTVIRGSEEAFIHLKHLLEVSVSHSIIYIRGLERFKLKDQRKLEDMFRSCPALIIISVEKPPLQLKEDGLLDEELYAYLSKTLIYLKPIRENPQELDELIRIFISENNEKYGKQIVGIRPKVEEVFHSHAWKGNLIELRDTIEEMVKSARGEYLDEKLLPTMNSIKFEYSSQYGTRLVNLNQSLQEIQKDIIQIVLQEEDMNQSRAANRLGLNRSTLWRILKD